MRDWFTINSKRIPCLLVPWQWNEKANMSSSVNVWSCTPAHVPSFESVAENCKFMPYITKCVVNFNINSK